MTLAGAVMGMSVTAMHRANERRAGRGVKFVRREGHRDAVRLTRIWD